MAIKRGYRLTPEEEAIVRGEVPKAADEPEVTPPAEDPSKKKRGTGSVWAVALALGLMMVIGYGFFYLVGGQRGEPKPESLYRTLLKEKAPDVFADLSPEQKQEIVAKLALTPQEEADFWPIFQKFFNEMTRSDQVHRKWLTLLWEEESPGVSFEEFEKGYLSVSERNTRIVKHHFELFSNLLGWERVPEVFLLYEKIRAETSPEHAKK